MIPTRSQPPNELLAARRLNLLTSCGPARWPAVRSQGELEVLPLVEPEIVTPVGFIYPAEAKASRALEARVLRLLFEH